MLLNTYKKEWKIIGERKELHIREMYVQ